MANITIPALPAQTGATDLDIMVIVDSGETTTSKITRFDLLNRIVLPQGTVSFQLQKADNTSAGGNSRGLYAVDIQSGRINADQVASGNYSVVVGYGNKASGTGSVALGNQNVATGNYSFTVGEQNNATNERGVALGWNVGVSGNAGFGAGRLSQVAGNQGAGFGNEARPAADASLVAGNQGYANNKNSFVMGAQGFSAIGDAQHSSTPIKGDGSIASGGTLLVQAQGSDVELYSTNRVYQIMLNWTAVCTVSAGGGSDPAVGSTIGQTQIMTFKKVGGTLSQVGTTSTLHTNNDASMSGATLTTSIVSNNIRYTFTAPTTTGYNTYRVVGTLYVSEVGW